MKTILLFLFILNQAAFGTSMKEDNFNISIFPVGSVDPANVQTAGQFILLHHLLRPLIKVDSQGQIEGDLVESWRVKDNFKHYTFKLKKDAKWSDGSAITTSDIEQSLRRQIKLNTANHFNFSSLEDVKIINEGEFSITLKESNILFIRQLSYPEFGVIKYKNSLPSYNITSGPYSLISQNDKETKIEINPYYPNFSKSAPKKVTFKNIPPNKLKEELETEALDFALPYSNSEEEIQSFVNHKSLKITEPHIGYTFWLSINPKSSLLNDASKKRFIQNLITKGTKAKVNEYKYIWKEADQLYLPDGLGRPSEEEIKKIWEDIETTSSKDGLVGKEIKFLTRTSFPFNKEIVHLLKIAGLNPIITEVNTGQEMWASIKKEKFDISLWSNDFSSLDLHENLQTTFNPIHTLVFTDEVDNQFQKELETALKIEDTFSRQIIYKDIAKKVLLKSYIAPIAYQKVVFIHKKQIDLSSWSSLFPEISLWKINIKK
jgi:ABC-type transport system substrate-binding protein